MSLLSKFFSKDSKSNMCLNLEKCAEVTLEEVLMQEIHGGDYKSHINRHLLSNKIQRQGHYWTTMDRNYF